MQLRLLGPLELLGRYSQPVAIGGSKERALLAVLTINAGHVVSEDRLVDALWGDQPPRTATRTLQSYLSRLRRYLTEAAKDGGAVLESHRGGWVLHLAPDAVDVGQVEALVTKGREAAAAGDHLGAALAFGDALQTWRGRPLEEFADQPWALLEATRLEELRQLIVEERIDAELACDRHAELAGQLEALCRTHPLRERLWGQRMLALYRSGRQAEALRVYQELRRTLGEELGIEPSPTVARLEQAILMHDPALELVPSTVPVATSAPGSVQARKLPTALVAFSGGPFVGRNGEMAALHKTWDEARTARRQVVFVAGEPGIGKTTLAAHLAGEAFEHGAVVLFGRCDEESVVPFQPFVEALTGYVEQTSAEELRATLGPQAGDLAVLVPAVGQVLPEAADYEPSSATTERYRSFEAVATLLCAIGASAPVLLMLDDLHWADRPTLLLLQHVLRRTESAPLLVLGTYRDTDLVRSHPMAETLAELRRANLVERISLRGLVRDDVLTLVAPDRAPTERDVELADALWSETEGSPLFLREILRHLEETASIARDEDGGWVALRRIDQLGIPEGVKEVIGRRLSRLSPAANTALQAGSVMGRELRLDVLEHITDLNADQLLDALDEATAAGVVDEVAGRVGRWTFTHALVRQALYEELSLTRRVRMHQRVAEALETIEAGDGAHLAELAYHFSQAAVAGQADKAIEYGRRAGRYALGIAAYEDAARHFATAVEVAEDAGLEPGARADLLLAQGDAEWRTGDARIARITFERVVALVEGKDPERQARAALGYAAGGIRAVWVEVWDVNERTVELLEGALDALADGDSILRAQLLASLGQELHFEAEAEVRRATLCEEAVAMARRLGDRRTLAHALACRNMASKLPSDAAGMIESATEVLDIAVPLGDRPFEAHAMRQRSIAYCQLNDIPAMKADLDRWTELVEELKDPVAASFGTFFHGALATLEGRFDEAEAKLRAAFAVAQASRDPNGIGSYLMCGGILRFFQGRFAELLSTAPMFISAYPRAAGWMEVGLAGFLADAGLVDDARILLDRVEPSNPIAMPRNVFWLLGVAVAAMACYRLRDPVKGEIVYGLLQPYAGANAGVFTASLGSADLALGWAAAAAGRADEARQHYEDAIAANEANGWRPSVAFSQVSYASLLSETGKTHDRARALVLVDEALATASALGMAGVVAEGTRLRAALTGETFPIGTRPRPPEPSRWDRTRARAVTAGRAAVARWTRNDTDEDLARRFGSNLSQRALFGALARAFQPTRLADFSGDITFELQPPPEVDGAASDWWTVEIRGRKATARRGRSQDAAVIIHTALATFVRMASGELNAIRALVDNIMEVDGDIFLAARLPDLFGAVSSDVLGEEAVAP
jgi:DNA-binding SARP family transcriptional activator/tetratricopeptide (TPR) repeat protein